jgi:pimeloyl-ACP methyl ester carboxylesterase
MSAAVRIDTVSLNYTRLYHERRGQGPPAVFVSGAFGDGDAFRHVSELLCGTYTTVCYDRRGNSRSPAPPNWHTTSLREQAADAAALIEHLGLGPALVWGSSLGGAIAFELTEHRPDLVRHAVLHDPVLPWLLEDSAQASEPIASACQPHLAVDDLRGAAEAMLRLVDGDDVYSGLPIDRRERMLGNAATLLHIELPALTAVNSDAPATPRVPLTISKGRASPAFLTAGADRLGQLLGVAPRLVPGAHVPQITHPDAVAATLRAVDYDVSRDRPSRAGSDVPREIR